MSAAMDGPPRRAGAGNRALNYAVVASLALHGTLLFVSLERKAGRDQAFPGPIVARLAPAPAAPPPPAVATAPEPPKPKAVEPPPPKVKPKAVAKPAVKPAPVAKPSPVPVPRNEAPAASVPAQPVAPAQSAEAAPSPASPSAPASAASADSAPAATPPSADVGFVERYRQQLIDVAKRYKRYPRAALDNNWEGRVVVRMVIGANGMIASMRVTTSSGHQILDKQAVDMLTKAKPLVPIPSAMRGQEFGVEIPVVYDLKDQPG